MTSFLILAAVVVSVLLLAERVVVTPLWFLLYGQDRTGILSERSMAVGEASALAEPATGMPVRVGDVLCMENVDVPNERVTV